MSDDIERRSRDVDEPKRRIPEAEERREPQERGERRDYREAVKSLLGDDDKRDRKGDSDDE